MIRVQRLIAVSVMLAAVLSAANKDAAGQQGELEVTLRVVDDVAGLAAARITIPPEASSREAPQATATPNTPAAEEPPAESSDAPPAASATQ